MNKWELARYIIDAKKCIDSMMFISNNYKQLGNINLRERLDKLRQDFYINLGVVLEKNFKNRDEKKEICKKDSLVEHIYYERDKNSAHRDENYTPKRYNSINDEIKTKKEEIIHIKDICKDKLPVDLTLDFVPHDKELFRLIHRINSQIENDANKIKYPLGTFHSYQLSEEGKQAFKEFDTEKQDREALKSFGLDYDKICKKEVLSSVDDIKNLSEEEKNRLAIIIEDGINSYEGLQNRQDFCIKANILHNLNMWVRPNNAQLNKIEELKRVGFYDAFEIPHLEILSDKNKEKQVEEIMEKNK